MNNVTIDWGLGFQEGYDEGLQKGKETSRMLMVNRVVKLNNKITLLERENKKLRDALKPFADVATRYDGEPPNRQVIVMLSDLRAARAALNGEK